MPNYEALERLAQDMGWVVKYSSDGYPSLYFPIYKCKSIDLDPTLPDHTHPAFIINGSEVDRRLIGIYKASAPVSGKALSLPNMPPLVNLGADELLTQIKAAGTSFSPKTVADSGLLLLLARKYNWVPKGNNDYGVHYADGTKWAAGASVVATNVRIFQGVAYTCVANHTTAWETRPDVAKHLWTRGHRVGGIPVASTISSSNPNGLTTLTGSGPASWNLNGMPNGITDLNGNCYDQDYGYRVNDGELQILANNNAADPSADISAGSTAWKAILPNVGDVGYTLVAPGTAGTLKWDKNGSAPKLDTVINTRTVDSEQLIVAFTSLTRNETNIPYVPSILQELGIFPISGDDTTGTVYYRNHAGVEYFPRRGGNYSIAPNAGLGCVSCISARSNVYASYGVRCACLD